MRELNAAPKRRNLVFESASELARAIRDGELSSVEVLEAFLARIEERNGAVNAVVTVDAERARLRARQADEALARGEVWGPLHGVPVTVKDVFDSAGLRTTAGHPPLKANLPERDATVVARLRGAGAILLGKTNTPAFAMDVQTENALFGSTNNPWDLSRTCGGSSGGEAAALADGMSALGFGSDIGGSVRIPAHYCGVYALKPTEGRVPMTGHILPGTVRSVRHLATPGPMARSVTDLRLGLQVLAGPDELDADVPPVPLVPTTARPLSDYRFAWTDELDGLPATAETRAAMTKLADDLTRAGCSVERVSPSDFDIEEVWRVYGELFAVLAFANLPLPARLIVRLLGRLLFSDPISRAGVRRATANARDYFVVRELRDRLSQSLERFLGDYDAWLCPVAATPAFPHRAMGKIETPIEVDGRRVPGNLGAIGYTCPFNLTGHPVVAAPLATSSDGLPIGVQIVGRSWCDMDLLNVAEALAEVTGDFRRPPI